MAERKGVRARPQVSLEWKVHDRPNKGSSEQQSEFRATLLRQNRDRMFYSRDLVVTLLFFTGGVE